jgi:hypothetical protein
MTDIQEHQKDATFKQKRTIMLFIVAAVVLFGIYQFFSDKEIETNGVYSKGVVLNAESTKGGMLITVGYTFHGGKYQSRFGATLGRKAIGRQYFIQFLPDRPNAIVFHKDKLVPDCLLNVDPPNDGWKEIPSCP